MAAKKKSVNRSDKNVQIKPSARGSTSSARSTVGGPARKPRSTRSASLGDALVGKQAAAEALAAAMPFNANKPKEYGPGSAKPEPGARTAPEDPRATGSTLTEAVPSAKAGSGEPALGQSPGSLPLDRVRTDACARLAAGISP